MNYIADAPNPFNLASPPPAFLAQMYAYDEKLVIFPSSVEAVYRLCRQSVGVPAPLLGMKGNPDAAVCRRYRLAPVKAILPAPFGHFGPHILADLRSYDTHAARAEGDCAADRLDKLDAMESEQIQRQENQDGYNLGREAYRTIKGLTGSTVHLGVTKPEGAGAYGAFAKRTQRRGKHVYRPSNHGVSGTGAIFSGR